jgi:hypothetical protein
MTMSQFLNQTMSDIRSGRDSWRVLTTLCSIAFAISIAVQFA